jgi:CAAX protease family protein
LGWIGFAPIVLTNLGRGIIPVDVPIEFIVIGTTSPTLGALWTQWLIHGDFRICRIYDSWRRMLVGAGTGVVLIYMAFVILPAVVIAKAPPNALHWAALWTPTTYAFNWSTFLGGPVNEEPGWRGFALPRLQERFGPIMGSVLLGMIWTGWHLPLFLLRNWISVPLWGFAAILICMSILMTWATNLGRFSVVIPMLMHVLFNLSSGVFGAVCQGIPTRVPELPAFLGVMTVVVLAVILLTRGRLGFQSGTSSTAYPAA